jgi:hypothetical protein
MNSAAVSLAISGGASKIGLEVSRSFATGVLTGSQVTWPPTINSDGIEPTGWYCLEYASGMPPLEAIETEYASGCPKAASLVPVCFVVVVLLVLVFEGKVGDLKLNATIRAVLAIRHAN